MINSTSPIQGHQPAPDGHDQLDITDIAVSSGLGYPDFGDVESITTRMLWHPPRRSRPLGDMSVHGVFAGVTGRTAGLESWRAAGRYTA
ncbi:hypothetical protein [Micromonospora sp. CA-248212]|uniref:hypothetical protein n=1 Tax=Micromonospora sp. CA-248212 TaxID=3239961 RepID=UPI003D8BEB57